MHDYLCSVSLGLLYILCLFLLVFDLIFLSSSQDYQDTTCTYSTIKVD